MINRKDFIRNTLMAFAVTLVPKILQPCIPNVPKLIFGWVSTWLFVTKGTIPK
jgi:hypothetical protein